MWLFVFPTCNTRWFVDFYVSLPPRRCNVSTRAANKTPKPTSEVPYVRILSIRRLLSWLAVDLTKLPPVKYQALDRDGHEVLVLVVYFGLSVMQLTPPICPGWSFKDPNCMWSPIPLSLLLTDHHSLPATPSSSVDMTPAPLASPPCSAPHSPTQARQTNARRLNM